MAQQSPQIKANEEAEARRIAHNRALALAYLHVFGSDGARSADQATVIDDLEQSCGFLRSTVRLNQFGAVDPQAMLMCEGSRQVYLRILDRLRDATKPPESPNPPAKG